MRHAVCHMGYALSEKQYALGMYIIRFAACVMPYFLTGIVLTVWGLCWYNLLWSCWFRCCSATLCCLVNLVSLHVSTLQHSVPQDLSLSMDFWKGNLLQRRFILWMSVTSHIDTCCTNLMDGAQYCPLILPWLGFLLTWPWGAAL